MARQRDVLVAGVATLMGAALYGLMGPTRPAPPKQVPPAAAPKANPTPGQMATCDSCNEKAQVLRQKLDLVMRENSALQRMVEDMDIVYNGVTNDWSDQIPEHLHPQAFEQYIAEALSDCVPSATLARLDCSEPPCLAMLLPGDGDWFDTLVRKCPAWTDNYPGQVASVRFQATCPDGTKELVQVLGWSPYTIEAWEGQTELLENYDKRLKLRYKEAADSWACTSAN